jgi:hypothetical protein
MHRGPDGVVIVTADMSISVALHVCLSPSPLIAIFSMMGSGNTSTLRGKHASLRPPEHSTARYSGEVRACFCLYRDLDSEILCREIRGPPLFSDVAPLLPKVLKFAFFLSASLFFLYSDNRAIASSFPVCGVLPPGPM